MENGIATDDLRILILSEEKDLFSSNRSNMAQRSTLEPTGSSPAGRNPFGFLFAQWREEGLNQEQLS